MRIIPTTYTPLRYPGFKKWFNEHAELLQLSHLGEYWVRDNRPEAEKFINSFRDAYNILATRIFNPLITE